VNAQDEHWSLVGHDMCTESKKAGEEAGEVLELVGGEVGGRGGVVMRVGNGPCAWGLGGGR